MVVLLGVGQFEAGMAEYLEAVVRNGLCEAEIMTPARKGPVRVR